MTSTTSPPAWRERAGFCDDSGLVVLRIGGRDRLTYLQTKLTADTRRWESDGGGHAFATDINGRVLFGGDFHVDPTHPDQVTLVLPDDQREAAIAHLEKWVILEDVTVAFDSDIHVLVLAPGTPAIAMLPAACVRLRGYAADLVLVGSDDLAHAQAALESAEIPRLARQAWHDALIPEGIALAGLDLRLGETIPLEAGAFHAVSFNKGCYLGQEVIERLHSRGRPNKRLLRVEVDGPPPAPDTRLHDPDGNEVGWITRAARGDDDARSVALAYVRRRALEAEVALRTADGADVSLRGYVGGERPGALS